MGISKTFSNKVPLGEKSEKCYIPLNNHIYYNIIIVYIDYELHAITFAVAHIFKALTDHQIIF